MDTAVDPRRPILWWILLVVLQSLHSSNAIQMPPMRDTQVVVDGFVEGIALHSVAFEFDDAEVMRLAAIEAAVKG